MKKLIFSLLIVLTTVGMAEDYVCYDNKYKLNNKYIYHGCSLKQHKCLNFNKKHFGKYPNKRLALKAFERCKNSKPKLVNRSKNLFEWNRIMYVNENWLKIYKTKHLQNYIDGISFGHFVKVKKIENNIWLIKKSGKYGLGKKVKGYIRINTKNFIFLDNNDTYENSFIKYLNRKGFKYRNQVYTLSSKLSNYILSSFNNSSNFNLLNKKEKKTIFYFYNWLNKYTMQVWANDIAYTRNKNDTLIVKKLYLLRLQIGNDIKIKTDKNYYMMLKDTLFPLPNYEILDFCKRNDLNNLAYKKFCKEQMTTILSPLKDSYEEDLLTTHKKINFINKNQALQLLNKFKKEKYPIMYYEKILNIAIYLYEQSDYKNALIASYLLEKAANGEAASVGRIDTIRYNLFRFKCNYHLNKDYSSYIKKIENEILKYNGNNSFLQIKNYLHISQFFIENSDIKSAYSYSHKALVAYLSNVKKLLKLLNTYQINIFFQNNANIISFYLNTAYQYKIKSSNIKEKVSKEATDAWLLYKGSIFDNENAIAMLKSSTKDRALKAKIDKLLSMQRALAKVYQSYPKKEQRDAWKKKIKELESKIDSIKSEIASKSTKFKEQLGLDTIGYKDIAKYLKSDELYVDYAYTKYGYYIFTIDSKANVRFIKIDESDFKEIDRLVKSFRDSVDSIIDNKLSKEELEKLTAKDKKRLNRLYTLILSKYIDEAIKDKSSLVISPDGALRLLPFEALVKDGKYLIELKGISYIASGREFVRVNRYAKGKVAKGVADIFANPKFDTTIESKEDKDESVTPNTNRGTTIRSLSRIRFGSLPGTQREAKAIADVLKSSVTVNEYLQKEASEDHLLSIKQPKILHIATHGFFINDNTIPNPMLKSGIVLSGANYSLMRRKSDGVVTALKLMGLKLEGTDLVVLSACQTGVVDINSTDSVSALGKAFIQAGAKDVLMSLWSVDDKQTANLMSSFYKEQQNTKEYKKALKDAKLKMINQNLHPAYWSAFVMSGL